MAQQVYNFRTVDSDVDLSPWLNKLSRPEVGAALIQAEIGRHQYAWRDKSGEGLPNDVSGGLTQVSIQHMPEIQPDGYIAKEDMNSPANHDAWKRWSWDIPKQMEYSIPRIEKCIQDAVRGLGNANDPNVPLLACLLWNAPNLGIIRNADGSPKYPVTDPRQRQAVAKHWLNPDLGDTDSSHAANLLNYQSALNFVRKNGFVHEQDEDTGAVPTMPDLTPYTPPQLPSVRKDDGKTTMDLIASAVEDLQQRFLVIDQQQHTQTDALGVISNKMYGPGSIQERIGTIVSILKGGSVAEQAAITAQTNGTQDDEQPDD